MRKTLSIFTMLLLTISIAAAADYAVQQPVNDYAHVLSADTVSMLNADLRQLQKTNTSQIAVLIVPDMAGDNIESYSMKAAERWKGGVKGKDNGVLITIAVKERKWRIEVGKGFEGSLMDSIAGRIGKDEMVPYLKRGDWNGAVIAGVKAIKKTIK
jgi:uncharacterized protein